MSKEFKRFVVESIDEKPEAQAHVDSEGVTFDPSVHSKNADGTPRTTSKGKFWKKGGTAVTGQQSTVGESKIMPPEYSTQGYMAAGMTSRLFSWYFGPSVAASPDDLEVLAYPMAKKFQEMGLEDLPTNWAIVMSVTLVFGPKIGGPELEHAKKRNQQLFGRKKRQENAYTGDRKNEHREDPTLEKSG